MDRSEIKTDHCYSMASVKGRRTVARVTDLFRITTMAAEKEGWPETLEAKPNRGEVCMATRRLPDRLVG